MPKYFLSCDWGTSSFRLALVNFSSLKVEEEIANDDGIKPLNEKNSFKSSLERFNTFCTYLDSQIETLSPLDEDIPIMISGMASSTLGLRELAYAKLPIPMDASHLCYEHFSLPSRRTAFLISGIQSGDGIARGEEVQALGLSNYLTGERQARLILPGTHSKHILFNAGRMVDIKTYMTGEIFELLSKKSILSEGIISSEWTEGNSSYKEGVRIGFESGALANVFRIRVNYIMHKSDPASNYYFLSGLLIGEELRALRSSDSRIVLAASEPLMQMYQLAIEEVIKSRNVFFIPKEIYSNASIRGHKLVLERVLSK